MQRQFQRLCLFGVVLGGGVCCGSAHSQQKIVKWEIRATVFEIADPNGLFPDVRLGDPVRGWVSFDLGSELDEDFSYGNVSSYSNLPGFHGVSMVIENPRSGAETQFIEDRRFDAISPGTLVSIANDDDDPDFGLVDWIAVDVAVLPPPGWTSGFADIAVVFAGPSTVLSDASLPGELNLDDWPQAIIELRDNFLHQDPTEIIAEIYSLTPVVVTPGDYDSNGIVDLADYDLWRRAFNGDESWPGVHNGDGNGDGAVDAADFVIWRANLGRTSDSASTAIGRVPEPGTTILLLLAAALGGCRRCKIAKRAHQLVDA